MNEYIYKYFIDHSLFKYLKTLKKRQTNYDIENTIKLKVSEESTDINIKLEPKKKMIIEKIYFMILIFLGIIITFHIIHFVLSDYVRNKFIKNNL